MAGLQSIMRAWAHLLAVALVWQLAACGSPDPPPPTETPEPTPPSGGPAPIETFTMADVFTRDESGVLGLALHPSFAANRLVYLVYTASDAGGPVARLVRYREVGNVLGEPAVLLDDVPAANIHNGSRVRFGPDGFLYVSFGDAAAPSVAQD